MKCYEHLSEEAVGVCLSCGRGLCRACAADAHGGLACRGRCEERVGLLLKAQDESFKVLAQTMATSERLLGLARKGFGGVAMFVLIIGVGFVAFGHRDWERMWVIALAGYVFMAFAAMILIGSRWLPTKFAGEDESKPLA
jgi:NAD(P)-dependent dehydrogenase (short-subunit alcohol dehydrogenase family)